MEPDYTPLAVATRTLDQALFRLYIAVRTWRDGFANQEQLLEALSIAERAEDVALDALPKRPVAETGLNKEHYSGSMAFPC